MRILYITHQYFPRHVGGTEVYTRGLVRRAVGDGHAAEVLTYHESDSGDPADFGPRVGEHEGVPLVEMHYNLSCAPDPPLYEYDNPFIGDAVACELERFGPDLVHVMHTMKLSGSTLKACRSKGIPVIVTLCDFWFICPRHTLLKYNGRTCGGPRHGLYCLKCVHDTHGFASSFPARRLPQWAATTHALIAGRARPRSELGTAIASLAPRRIRLREMLLGADRILALSEFQKKMFVQNGYPQDRLEVLDHGIETDGLGRGSRTGSDPPRVVFIGSLVEHKGAHVLIEALQRDRSLPLELWIYGSGPDSYRRRLARAAAGDDRVRLMGEFPPEQLAPVLAGATLLAAPSLWFENSPIAIKAALFMGVPVLASDLGSLPEWIEVGRDGWLAPAGDAGAWASALRKAIREAGSMSPDSSRVKSMDRHAGEIFEIYSELLAGGS